MFVTHCAKYMSLTFANNADVSRRSHTINIAIDKNIQTCTNSTRALIFRTGVLYSAACSPGAGALNVRYQQSNNGKV